MPQTSTIKLGALMALTALVAACQQPATVSVQPTRMPPQPATVTAVLAPPATPMFHVQGKLEAFLTCVAHLNPLVPEGYPAIDEQGRLYCPMLATYSGPTRGKIKGTLAGTDHVKAYLNPDYTLKAGDFNLVDVVTDEKGETLVATAIGHGVVMKNGEVPFSQTYTVVASAGGATTSKKYRHYIGKTFFCPGLVAADFQSVSMMWLE